MKKVKRRWKWDIHLLGNLNIIYLLGIVFVVMASHSMACILLLNGWEPMPVENRTDLADVVVVAKTRKTFKNTRTSVNTYSAEFELLDILKGYNTIKNLGDNITKTVYNISNFGDRKACYADVDTDSTYILFLTLYKERLSAKYDDLFGATADHNVINEERILVHQGWKPWSVWSSCSVSCAGGIQTRQRLCTVNITCDGLDAQQRQCNTFQCKGSVDLLNLFKQSNILPSGISVVQERQKAYHFSSNARVNIPTSQLFPNYFPKDFSVIITAKPNISNKGYLLTIGNIIGKTVLFGVQVGKTPRFELEKTTSVPGRRRLKFNFNVSDGKWHQFSYSLRDRYVSFYADCKLIAVKALMRNYATYAYISSKTITSIGNSYIKKKRYPQYEGDIEELTIVPNPEAASKQCHQKSGPFTDIPHGNGVSPTESPSQLTTTDEKNYMISWTAWSQCSVTCGPGQQTRTAYCPHFTLDQCYSVSNGAVQTRPCLMEPCDNQSLVATCKYPCYNGGVCTKSGRCHCAEGYYGTQCQIVSCNPGCYNGGQCVVPDTCFCLPGWEGPQCEKARCHPECSNGGLCIRPGVCSCPYGYLPPHCTPVCSTSCYNGGTCVGFNYCKCLTGYAGNLCQSAICEEGCGRGGECIGPNVCICSAGWTGPACKKALCVPDCQNGGTCLLPYLCLCLHGTYGLFCEKHMCSPGCMNSGVCIGRNTCSCPSGYSGSICQHKICPFGCLHGGVCTSDGCKCRLGYHGDACERRLCRYVPYKRSFIRGHWEPVNTHECIKNCEAERESRKMVYRTHYQTVYRCT